MKATVIKIITNKEGKQLTAMLQIDTFVKLGNKVVKSLKPQFVYVRNDGFLEDEQFEVSGKVVDWKTVTTKTGEEVVLKTLAAE